MYFTLTSIKSFGPLSNIVKLIFVGSFGRVHLAQKDPKGRVRIGGFIEKYIWLFWLLIWNDLCPILAKYFVTYFQEGGFFLSPFLVSSQCHWTHFDLIAQKSYVLNLQPANIIGSQIPIVVHFSWITLWHKGFWKYIPKLVDAATSSFNITECAMCSIKKSTN